MAYSTKTIGIALSFIHLMLGVLCLVFGVVAMKLKEAEYNDGLYGIGIWLGIWMLLNTLGGLLVAHKPTDRCRISCYIGFCCVSMVIMVICCIPLIVGPLVHFSFESKANKDYYKRYGPERIYIKSQSYFDERNRIGSIGCAIYGTLLFVILLDVLITSVACHIWKHAINKLQNPRRPTRRQSQTNTVQNTPPSFVYPNNNMVIQSGFVINAAYLHPKLPSYTDIYPEGSPTWGNQSTDLSAPPPYSETPPTHNNATLQTRPYSETGATPNNATQQATPYSETGATPNNATQQATPYSETQVTPNNNVLPIEDPPSYHT